MPPVVLLHTTSKATSTVSLAATTTSRRVPASTPQLAERPASSTVCLPSAATRVLLALLPMDTPGRASRMMVYPSTSVSTPVVVVITWTWPVLGAPMCPPPHAAHSSDMAESMQIGAREVRNARAGGMGRTLRHGGVSS